jgi:putative restriction endonuclease
MLDDTAVRLAAFRFLEEQQRLAGDEGALPHRVLLKGFVHEGHRVPLMGPQGIFKPRVLRDIPLSITTVAVTAGEARPYDDAFGEDGLLRYRYRGTDPGHHENVGLRLAMQRHVPLVYPMLVHGLQGFHGARLRVPRAPASQPDRRLLEERFQHFRQLGG